LRKVHSSWMLAVSDRAGFAERELRNIADQGLLRLDIRRSDHLAPLLGFVRDELAEIGG
jgi:hypothetical protein